MIYGYAPFGTPSWINYADRRVAIGASSAAYARLMVACLELLEGAPFGCWKIAVTRPTASEWQPSERTAAAAERTKRSGGKTHERMIKLRT